MTDQRLPPCVHALNAGLKESPKVNFLTELGKFAASAQAKEPIARLSDVLTAARAALELDVIPAADAVHSVDDISAYVQRLVVYLSLVKGFTEPPAPSNASDAASTTSVTSSTAQALQQPLIDHPEATPDQEAPSTKDSDHAAATETTSVTTATVAAPVQGADGSARRSECLRFCKWRDALLDSTVFALNARHEYAHVLLSAGLRMMSIARQKTDALLAQRLSETDDTQLKLAYQLLLHAAGVLEACLEAMKITPRVIGAPVADLGAGPQENGQAIPDDDAMAKWRAEQLRGANNSSNQQLDLESLDRVADLAHGHFPQLLLWIALAQAQELVLLRGVTRETVDYALMAKLAMDLSVRYKESYTFAVRSLPCASSQVADRVRLYCAFKAPYYLSVSAYFQGAAFMFREASGADSKACVVAIADFKKAKALFAAQCAPREKEYESKPGSQREEKPRCALLQSVFLRCEQVIDRDLDVMTHRNDSVYYEPIPDPEPASDPVGLVRAVSVPVIRVNPIWTDRQIASCLQPPPTDVNANANANASDKPRESCCQSCVIS